MRVIAEYTVSSEFDIDFNPNEVADWCVVRDTLHVLTDENGEWVSIDAVSTIKDDLASLDAPDRVMTVDHCCGHCLERSLFAWKSSLDKNSRVQE